MSGKWHGEAAPTRDQVVAEIGRELAKRRQLFPTWIEAGRITRKQADERIDRLQAAYDYITAHWPRDQQELPL
jgi:hypothetical protein